MDFEEAIYILSGLSNARMSVINSERTMVMRIKFFFKKGQNMNALRAKLQEMVKQ